MLSTGYDDRCDATMTQEMATAAFRFGHTLIRNLLPRMNSEYEENGEAIDLKVGAFHFIGLLPFRALLRISVSMTRYGDVIFVRICIYLSRYPFGSWN